jgi:hypothetical protein
MMQSRIWKRQPGTSTEKSKKENMTLQELHHAVLKLDWKQQDLFASNLESIFIKNNPLWDGPLILIPFFAFSELNEALLKATGKWEESK